MSVENPRAPITITNPGPQTLLGAVGSPYAKNAFPVAPGIAEAAPTGVEVTPAQAAGLGGEALEAAGATGPSDVAQSIAEQGRAAGLNITAPEGRAPVAGNSQAGLSAVRNRVGGPQ